MAISNAERQSKIYGSMDYGMKISKSGHGVGENPRFHIMNSGKPTLKLFRSGEGEEYKAIDGGGFTVEILHNLGYVPIVFVDGEYFDTPGEAVVHRYSDWNRWIYQGLQVADLYSYNADETKLYIKFSASYLTDAYAFTLKYQYHIFYDEAKLQ